MHKKQYLILFVEVFKKIIQKKAKEPKGFADTYC